MKALIDTCVIIDALQNRNPYAKEAKEIFIASALTHFEGYITAKATADIYYLTHHCTHNIEETNTILNNIFKLFNVLDTTSEDCYNAVSSTTTDYEDTMMIESAKRSSMDCIVTRNLKDYGHSTVPVYSPEQFLKLIS